MIQWHLGSQELMDNNPMENVLKKSQTPLYSLHVELIYIQSETIFKCYLSCTATESQPV